MDSQALLEALKSSLAQEKESMSNFNTDNLSLWESNPSMETECPHLLSMSVLSGLCDEDSLGLSEEYTFVAPLDSFENSFEHLKQDDLRQKSLRNEAIDILDTFRVEDPIIYISSEDDMDNVSTLSSDEYEVSDKSSTHSFGSRDIWTIRVQNNEEGALRYFQLIPNDRSASMILEGEEILESIKALVADDPQVEFVVRIERDDVTTVMQNSNEVLKFLGSMLGSNQDTSRNSCEGNRKVGECRVFNLDDFNLDETAMDTSFRSSRLSI